MSYPYNPSLYSEEHELFRETLRRFIRDEIEPNVDRWLDNHGIENEFWLKAGAAGILGVDIPEDYGGPGGDFLHRIVLAEEIGYSPAGASMAPALAAGNGQGRDPLRSRDHGTDFQNTRFKLAEIKTELAVGRAFLDEIVRDYTANGRLDTLKCAMAKMWVCEMEGRVIDQCVQLHGGAGYMDEYPVSRLYTAARIFAGTSEIMRLIVGRTI